MSKNWFELLKLARDLGTEADFQYVEGGVQKTGIELRFGTDELAAATDLVPKDASAWISKFVRWGYARRVGSIEQPGLKPKGVYALTEYGRSVEPKKVNRLKRLMGAVGTFLEADEDTQPAALRKLIETYNDLGKANKKESKKRTGK